MDALKRFGLVMAGVFGAGIVFVLVLKGYFLAPLLFVGLIVAGTLTAVFAVIPLWSEFVMGKRLSPWEALMLFRKEGSGDHANDHRWFLFAGITVVATIIYWQIPGPSQVMYMIYAMWHWLSSSARQSVVDLWNAFYCGNDCGPAQPEWRPDGLGWHPLQSAMFRVTFAYWMLLSSYAGIAFREELGGAIAHYVELIERHRETHHQKKLAEAEAASEATHQKELADWQKAIDAQQKQGGKKKGAPLPPRPEKKQAEVKAPHLWQFLTPILAVEIGGEVIEEFIRLWHKRHKE